MKKWSERGLNVREVAERKKKEPEKIILISSLTSNKNSINSKIRKFSNKLINTTEMPEDVN